MAELADAPDLGSGGEIRRGSSPLPGISTNDRGSDIRNNGFSQGCGHVIMRGAVERSCQLRAGIRVVVGTAIATVTSGLFSAFDAFFAVTRQSVPLKAKAKLRFAEDEGYIRIF